MTNRFYLFLLIGGLILAALVAYIVVNGIYPGSSHIGIVVNPETKICKDFIWNQPPFISVSKRPERSDEGGIYYGLVDSWLSGGVDAAGSGGSQLLSLQTPYGTCYGTASSCCGRLGLSYGGLSTTFPHALKVEAFGSIGMKFGLMGLVVLGVYLVHKNIRSTKKEKNIHGKPEA